ncbi:dihydroorotate dehydrogenase, partial [Phenoliferia sp. Uapishka_3]
MLRSTLRLSAPLKRFPAGRRTLATAAEATAQPPKSAGKGLRSAALSTVLITGTAAFIYYARDSQAGVHRWVGLPIVAALTKDDPELAHEIAVKVIGSGFAPIDRGVDDEVLKMELFGKSYSNPIGIAAGFDKHAEAIDGLFSLGFGYVEIGSVTPEPQVRLHFPQTSRCPADTTPSIPSQAGNPKPRVFRVPETKSLVNRYGFNSEGHLSVLARLRTRITSFVTSYASALPPSLFPLPPPNAPLSYDVTNALLSSPAGIEARVPDTLNLPRSLHQGKILAINLGKNKTSDPDSIDDFVNGVTTLGPYADVLVINVSSPNTPGLRDLQRREMVESLLSGVLSARNSLPGTIRPPVLVKIAPDLDNGQLEDIAAAVLASGADGIIVSNTTISRPPSAGSSPALKEAGGLSGPPVKPLALLALSKLYEVTEGKVPLIGCGGISSGQDAVDFAKAGASLVQMYTAMVYDGFGLARRIKDEATEILTRENTTWKAVVGSGARKLMEEKRLALEEAKAKIVVIPAEEFEKELEGAQKELETLLVQLAEVEAPLPEVTESPVDITTPITPVPALVADSIPSQPDSSSVPPFEAPGPDIVLIEVIPEPVVVEPVVIVEPVIPTPPVVLKEVVDIAQSPLAVPANAILNEDKEKVVLDPATAQVEAGVVTEKPIEEKKAPKVDEGKRWV